MDTCIRPRSKDTPVGPLGAQSNDDVLLLQQSLNCDSVEEVDALNCNGEWYRAFIVNRTDSGVFVHFEGKAKSCDESMYMFQEVDALDDKKEWYQALIIKRTDAGVLVHYEGKGPSCDEVIPLSDAPARIRVRCKTYADRYVEASEDVVLHIPPCSTWLHNRAMCSVPMASG